MRRWGRVRSASGGDCCSPQTAQAQTHHALPLRRGRLPPAHRASSLALSCAGPLKRDLLCLGGAQDAVDVLQQASRVPSRVPRVLGERHVHLEPQILLLDLIRGWISDRRQGGTLRGARAARTLPAMECNSRSASSYFPALSWRGWGSPTGVLHHGSHELEQRVRPFRLCTVGRRHGDFGC